MALSTFSHQYSFRSLPTRITIQPTNAALCAKPVSNFSYCCYSLTSSYCLCQRPSLPSTSSILPARIGNQTNTGCLQNCSSLQYAKLHYHQKHGVGGVKLTRTSAVASDIEAGTVVESAPATGMGVSVLINGASGKMGQAVGEAAVRAGLELAPYGLAGPMVPNHKVDIQGVTVDVHGSEHRDKILDEALARYPNLIIVDYTLPAAVNNNAEWYCERGIPFVMGTTGGDREKLLETVTKAGNYAVIAPQMGKQVVAFIAAMEALSEACPGAFSGYSLKVTESHQSTKVDTSGTAKEIVAAFRKLGIVYSNDEIEMVRDPPEQMERMKVPEEYLKGHAFHTYRVTSADGTVSFEFQHNVCGRTIYAEGTVDAVLFLAKKVKEGADKRLYNMVDVLRGGAMR